MIFGKSLTDDLKSLQLNSDIFIHARTMNTNIYIYNTIHIYINIVTNN